MHWTPRNATRCLLFLMFATLSSAQIPVPDDPETAADKVYQAHDWKSSEAAYSSLTQKAPSNFRFWYRLATAQKSLGKYDAALDSFATAEKAGTPRYLSQYAIAETQALKGNPTASFTALDEALKSGYALPDQLSADADLASLHNDPRFVKILEQTKRAQAPCKFGPEFRQFDFWIGEWNVVIAKGEMPAGDSRIELSLGDCVIVENWTSKNSLYAGKSYNVYNVTEKRWEQFWVDNSAGMIHFYGGLKDGVMDYWTDEIPQPSGPALKRHLQFIQLGPDKVRQYSQGSTDGGKSWKPEYDFTYIRKK